MGLVSGRRSEPRPVRLSEIREERDQSGQRSGEGGGATVIRVHCKRSDCSGAPVPPHFGAHLHEDYVFFGADAELPLQTLRNIAQLNGRRGECTRRTQL